MSLDLIVLGNLLMDDLVFPDGRTRMAQPGGAVLYGSLAASLWGLRIGVASVLGDDYPARPIEALTSRGVDLGGVRSLGRPGVRTWLLYEGERRQVVHRLDRPTHAEVSPRPQDLPSTWADARAFHLAPMPFDVQRGLVEALSSRPGAFLSLDPYRLLSVESLEEWRSVISHVDAFFLSEDEMEIEAARADPRPTLRALAGGRLRFVFFKRGARGGILYDARQDRFLEWPGRAAGVVDATGAGDAFASGFLAGWLRGEPLPRALERGVVGASFAIADWGPLGLLGASGDQAEARRREWFGA